MAYWGIFSSSETDAAKKYPNKLRLFEKPLGQARLNCQPPMFFFFLRSVSLVCRIGSTESESVSRLAEFESMMDKMLPLPNWELAPIPVVPVRPVSYRSMQ